MATVKKAKTKKSTPDDNAIISIYMNEVLENNEAPKNVYVFCKKHAIEESDFYAFFGSLEALKQDIWVKFFENAVATIEKEVAFESYSDKNKLLTLYFTLFEILTLNRSYVLFSLKENNEGLKNLKQLKTFRNHFKKYIVDSITSEPSEPFGKVAKVTEPVYAEGAWLQFLFLLKFWMDDTSKGFEKTDVLIEKSVNTVVDLLNTKPLESLFDLGKFLWKEKMQ
ncbi:TetR family transcriptional regulator C-terminal domain-containing protein [Flavobacterium sedimenticola]|uniref:TetR family transcriptional regulator C-terminal domain-containing protein n=1 Tax=Flavobacterium sedimenticola TaxID=3043286 RepID=A0ABT6XQQ9_9FLAO|nr:TetR family transcriptional regulator C-terminal domain-containing protein [Flavobacterium sedimenticola]MDI9257401.1 TetR family transcriptional regulator C-terminal domain-containing protein [Flavobacterium sedimenticola]